MQKRMPTILSLALVMSSSLALSFIPCKEDVDCPQEQYCHASIDPDDLRCTNCINCQILQREHDVTCAKNFSQCGHCLAGYEEQQLTDAVKEQKKSCIKTEKGNDDGVIEHCATDQDCTRKPARFCYKGTFCAKCVNCSIYNRYPDHNIGCPKNLADCGPCYDGYLNIDVTDESGPKACGAQLPVISEHLTKPTITVNVSALSHTLASLLIVVVAVLCAILIFRSLRPTDRAETSIEMGEISMAPPPYVATVSNTRDESSDDMTVCGFINETKHTECSARVFRLPSYQNPGTTSEGPDLVDEDTMPCEWRPSRQDYDGTDCIHLTERGSPQPNNNTATPSDVNAYDEEPSPKRRK